VTKTNPACLDWSGEWEWLCAWLIHLEESIALWNVTIMSCAQLLHQAAVCIFMFLLRMAIATAESVMHEPLKVALTNWHWLSKL
jgi:hypothetical protein